MVRFFHQFLFPFIFAFSGAIPLIGQELPLTHIPEVTVVKSNREFFSEDQTILTVEPALTLLNRHQSLGYLLERETPAMVRNYGGAGSLFRFIAWYGKQSYPGQLERFSFKFPNDGTGGSGINPHWFYAIGGSSERSVRSFVR